MTPKTLNGIATNISTGCKKERNSITSTRYIMSSSIGNAVAKVLNEFWFSDSWPMSKLKSLACRPYVFNLVSVNSFLTASWASVTNVVVSVPSKLALTATFG